MVVLRLMCPTAVVSEFTSMPFVVGIVGGLFWYTWNVGRTCTVDPLTF